MNFSLDTKPSASDETMFGCECALPFLTGWHGSAMRQGAVSAVALGALMTLAACDATPQDGSRDEAAGKVSATFDKSDRQIARAEARFNKVERQARSVAEGAGPQPR